MAEVASSSPREVEKPQKVRPEKPDEEKYKAELAQAEKEHSEAQAKLNAIKAKIDSTRPRDQESPAAQRQKELRAELSAVRQQQSGFKSSRGSTQEKIAALDAQLKSRLAENKAARSRFSFKSAEEIDREIQRLEKQVESGSMKLVDERKALAESSNLRKQKKGFSALDDQQKGIDDIKGQISELRKTLDNPEAKALGEKMGTITKELDEIKAGQDSEFKNLNALRDERTKLQADQRVKFSALKELKDNYYKAKAAFRDYEQDMWRARQEKQRAEREAFAREKRKKVAEKKLEEASQPAYLDEILTAEGLIRYFDPNAPVETKTLRAPSGFAAEAQRTIDAAPMKGTALSKKEDRDDTYFIGNGGKKGKKGKKGGAAASGSPAPFNLSMGVIEELSKVNVSAPSNQGDVPAVVEKLKTKVTQWKADQAKKTSDNIARAQAEIDKLEAEAVEESSNPASRRAQDHAKKPAQANAGLGTNASATAELKQEKDADADVAEELKKAKIEDQQQPDEVTA